MKIVSLIAILVLACGCAESAMQSQELHLEPIDSHDAVPQEIVSFVDSWYRAWHMSDRDALDSLLLDGAPESVAFPKQERVEYSIVDFDTLETRGSLHGAERGDLSVFIMESQGAARQDSLRRHMLLRSVDGTLKAVSYSTVNEKTLPEEY